MTDDAVSTFDDRDFDRLVDGELTEDRRRELLSRLDRETDGWRRCALAFLEAQEWRGSFPHELRAADPFPGREQGTVRRSLPKRTSSVAKRLSIAAVVLAAFSLGWITRGDGPAAPIDLSERRVPADVVPQTPVADSSPPQSPKPPAVAEAAAGLDVRLAGTIRWHVEQDGREREIPVLEGSTVDLQRLLSQLPTISEKARLALERRGQKVEVHRQLLTVDLDDGRSVVVPVDQVQVRVAGRMFQ